MDRLTAFRLVATLLIVMGALGAAKGLRDGAVRNRQFVRFTRADNPASYWFYIGLTGAVSAFGAAILIWTLY
jgi:hypothetical protein